MGCMNYIEALVRDSDLPVDADLGVKKYIFIAMNAITLMAVYNGFGASGLTSTSGGLGVVSLCGIVAVLSISVTVSVVVSKKVRRGMLCGIMITFASCVVVLDAITLGVLDLWILQILVLDGCLAWGVPSWASRVAFSLQLAYLIVNMAQDTQGLGLWEQVAATAGSDERYTPYQCPQLNSSLGLAALSVRLATFFFDFVVTRGFAATMQSQFEAMQASQHVTETLTLHLSGYEVEAARALVDGEEAAALPEALRESFLQLITNLETYKPYLPQSCLPGEGADDAGYTESENTEETGASGRRSSMLSDSRGSPCRSSRGSDPTRRSSHGSITSEAAASIRRPSASVNVARGAVRAVPQRLTVSCICTNVRGFLPWLYARGPGAAQALLQTEVERFAKGVTQCRGVVDLLCGDHCRASFNAARNCGTHRVSAARAATAFTRQPSSEPPPACSPEEVRLSSAVCSGAAVCGDFGSAAIVRPMIIGGVHNTLTVLERLAARWGTPVLADATVHSDIADTWRCRLLGAASFPKLGARDFLLWEADGERGRGSEENPEEWMYELAGQNPDPWEEHTAALRQWLGGDAAAAQALAGAALEKQAEGPVRAALESLRADSSSGQPVPRYELSEGWAANVGGAVPGFTLVAEPHIQRGRSTRRASPLHGRRNRQASELVVNDL
eukprot:TRINITY_DN14011_c0_g4_i1.p1 TRINITY_DN14011_c0_g4~~TRINITY_DN14011_c0_g4_i1.p1  ORF type:complete len:701 (+),score=167.97 TRINITY_DN14011_c0_g4_i1:82-2103(+)